MQQNQTLNPKPNQSQALPLCMCIQKKFVRKKQIVQSP
jgi:hypothetical protein